MQLTERTQEADVANQKTAIAVADGQRKAADLQPQIDDLQTKQTDRGLILTLGDVLFTTGTANLNMGAGTQLTKLAGFLNKYPDRSAQIEGLHRQRRERGLQPGSVAASCRCSEELPGALGNRYSTPDGHRQRREFARRRQRHGDRSPAEPACGSDHPQQPGFGPLALDQRRTAAPRCGAGCFFFFSPRVPRTQSRVVPQARSARGARCRRRAA
jgi:hypothetical protein